ncbi:MAG: Ig-like domain-containing protein [Deltaproteobacteria bacterium]|nr:Ig-like domain-containing protein [Deltaproteobacteria bacterium]
MSLFLSAFILLGCKDPEVVVPEHNLLGISVAPVDALVAKGGEVQFVAKAYYEDYSSEVITDQVSWESTDPRTLSVSSAGLGRGLEEGEASVVVSLDPEHTTRVDVRVSGSPVTALTLRPASMELHPGDSAQIEAVARFEDGTEGNIAGSCAWSSDNAASATVDGAGAVDALRPGEAVIHAACAGSMGGDASVVVVEEEAVLPLPDLQVTGFEGVGVDGVVLYEVEVKNRGQGLAGSFYLDLVLDSPSAPGQDHDLDGLEWVSSLGAGESVTKTIEVDGVSPGTYRSWVIADPDRWVDESDEGNNVGGPLSISLSATALPDLAVVSFDAMSDGRDTLYWITVENRGEVASADYWVDVFKDRNDAPAVGELGQLYANMPGLDPGEQVDLEFDYAGGPGVDGWFSWVLLDSQGSVHELDEDNNAEMVLVEVW